MFVLRIAASCMCFVRRDVPHHSQKICASNLGGRLTSTQSEIETYTNHVVEVETDIDVSSQIGKNVPFTFSAKLLSHWPLCQESAHTLWWGGMVTLVI